MKILVTGAAGFIGFHLVKKLLNYDFTLVGLDSINDYYDVNIKYARLTELGINNKRIKEGEIIRGSNNNFSFFKVNLENKSAIKSLFKTQKFDIVINLAAQAGVRYSLTNPDAYINSNICGFMNIIECCRHMNVKHLIYASSSSVYGSNEKMPFSTKHNVDHPVSLYAATKKANELISHSYSHLYNLPTTGLRFFTVYGPWGRPDMALFLFTDAILNNRPIDVYNHGKMKRDFTFIDDIVEGISRIIESNPPEGDNNWSSINPNPASSSAPYRIYNIGNNNPVDLIDFIEAIEKSLGMKAQRNLMPLQLGDVVNTEADVDDLVKDFDYRPSTSVQHGVDQFIKWYREYYKIK